MGKFSTNIGYYIFGDFEGTNDMEDWLVSMQCWYTGYETSLANIWKKYHILSGLWNFRICRIRNSNKFISKTIHSEVSAWIVSKGFSEFELLEACLKVGDLLSNIIVINEFSDIVKFGPIKFEFRFVIYRFNSTFVGFNSTLLSFFIFHLN